MAKRNRAEFNEWLVARTEPIVVGAKEYKPIDLLTDSSDVMYNVVYERWAARDAGATDAHSGIALEDLN